ncbi:MAG: regulatory protein TetR [Actinomycetia bacterium]|nr:regulatory protein TetR [Actinomycetes bacterium]
MGRPCRSEDTILQATFDLVAEHGVGGVTVDAVAARAGVGKQTIYRHWGSRAHLIHAAISCMAVDEEVPDTGTLRGDLTVMLQQLVDFLGQSDAGRVLPSLIDAAERDAELHELRQVHIAQRRGTFEHVLRRGIDRGELDAGTDLDLVTDLLVGPFFYKRLVSQRAVSTVDVDKVLDLVLRGVGASARADA